MSKFFYISFEHAKSVCMTLKFFTIAHLLEMHLGKVNFTLRTATFYLDS